MIKIVPELEPNVIVGAEAKNVRFDVRPVMRTPERSDVGVFGIRAARNLNHNAADLTGVAVKILDLRAHLRVPDEPLNRRLGLGAGPAGRTFGSTGTGVPPGPRSTSR